MRYSIEPSDRRYIKGYQFLYFAKNIDKNISNKYSQKLVDRATKYGATKVATDAIKTASKRAIEKTAEATGDPSKNKPSSTSKNSKELPQQNCIQMNLIMKYQKKDKYLKKKDNKLLIN